MPDFNKEISQPVKGMSEDHPMSANSQSYSFALNADLEGFDGNGFPLLNNNQSNILCTGFPAGYKVRGFTNIVEQNRIIWYLYNSATGQSEIGETLNPQDCRKKIEDGILNGCDDCGSVVTKESVPLELQTAVGCCQYSKIANDPCFEFSDNYPVNSTDYLITNCGITLSITDNKNVYRVIKLVNDPDSDKLLIDPTYYVITGYEDEPCQIPIYGTAIDCNKLAYQPHAVIPCIEFIDLVPGGSNPAGSYQFFIAYADEKANRLTSVFSSTNIIPIKDKEVTFETNYKTDKAIVLNIHNLFEGGPYSYYQILVAKTIDLTTSFYVAATLPITQTKYTYTGNKEDELKITEEDIFARFPIYNTVKSITSSNNIRFLAGLTESPKLNLQRVANKIKLQWQTIAVPERAYRNARNVNKFRTCMRDEVYPYGVQFIIGNKETSVYHIPGRESKITDLEIIDNNDVVKENNCVPCGNIDMDNQVILTNLNTTVVPPISGGIVLQEENIGQAASCPLTPYTASGCSEANSLYNPPTVDAGEDQTLTDGTGGFLSGFAEARDGSLRYTKWTQLSGPNKVDLQNPNTAAAFFSNYNAGVYVFQLCAEDTHGARRIDSVTITVDIPPNVAPVANAGTDKIVTLPENKSYLNGATSNDEDGSIVSYLWSRVSGPNTPTIAQTKRAYTEVSGLIEGTYVFKLVVTDDKGCVSEATTKIYVVGNPENVIPSCVNHLYPVNGTVTSSFKTVVLQWQSGAYVSSYDVFLRKEGDSFSLIGSSISETYTLTNLLPNTIYHWYVRPVNSIGAPSGCATYYRSFVTPAESQVEGCEKRRWEIYNTATVVGGSLEVYKDCEETCYQYGDFAYWESEKTYPNDPVVWGELCGKPIRHPKYPDSYISHIHDGENSSLDYTRDNIIYPIGVKVDFQSVRDAIASAVTDKIITQLEADSIVGYRIVRGNRFQNKSIQAKGILFDINQYQRKNKGTNFDDKPIYFSNYNYNDLRANPFITDDFENYEDHNKQKGPDLPFIFSNRYSFHSPDTHFNESSIGTKLKLETVEYGQSEGYFNISQDQSKQKFLSDTSYMIAFTSGLLAALTRVEEKETIEYTSQGNIISGMGVASGTLGPFLPSLNFGTKIDDTIVNYSRAGAIIPANQTTVTTIQGKRKDWLNPYFMAKRKPFLLPFLPLLIINSVTDFLSVVLQEANIVIDLIKALTPYRDWSVQYNSVGKYNAYKAIPNNGNKIRSITSSSYLKSENAFVSEPSELNPNNYNSIKVNNWGRESSVYLRYGGVEVPNASVRSGIVDNSRNALNSSVFNCQLNKKSYTNISSYYAAIKNYVPDQYGEIYDIEYLLTDSCIFPTDIASDTCKGVYGGDTFINRFAFKTKVPYFLATTFKLPNGTDFNYDMYPNLAVPRHYYDSNVGVGENIQNIGDVLSLFTPDGIASFLGRPKSIRDCNTNKFFYQNGYIYLYSYGIPYFLVESDINVDFRHAENSQEKAFYPQQSDLDFWFQERNVPIKEDNYYFYNRSYSKQNKEGVLTIDGPGFKPGKECLVTHPNRIIYSTDRISNIFKLNDVTDIPLNKGKIISIDGIENDSVLVRAENGVQLFQAVVRVPIEGQTFQFGNGSVFSNPPRDFAETTLGYIGSQHRAILHTEFGHIFTDMRRGNIFNLENGGGGIDEICRYGMKNWFKENLPFKILRDFKNMPEDHTDNNLGGLGIAMAFDKRYNRFFLTKLDYKKKDKNVLYDENSREFYLPGTTRTIIKLGDKKYFEDCSWTISYNFQAKSWSSFYSFKPNYYLDFVEAFGSGNDKGFWLHGLTNSSFQVYYGEKYPYIWEPFIKFDVPLKNLNSVEFDTEVKRYNNEYDFYLKNIPGYNKVVVYNDNYNSGLLNLIPSDKNNLSKVGKYPIRGLDNWGIEVTQANYKWRFNQFYDLKKDHSEVPLWLYKGNNAEKELNPIAFNYGKSDFNLARIKGQWFKLRFINDSITNYKIISKFAITNQVTQYK